MSLQLITPGESLSAEHPVADEGSLSAVPAKVGSEVRGLPVHLATASNVANMLLLLTHTRTSVKNREMKDELVFSVNVNILNELFIPSARLFAVGAGAGHPA